MFIFCRNTENSVNTKGDFDDTTNTAAKNLKNESDTKKDFFAVYKRVHKKKSFK